MRNNRTMQLVGWAAVVFCGAMPVWANPLDFASYEQEVTAQFVSEAAARAATLRAAELPEGCSRVFTTRWDDSILHTWRRPRCWRRTACGRPFT